MTEARAKGLIRSTESREVRALKSTELTGRRTIAWKWAQTGLNLPSVAGRLNANWTQNTN